MMLSVKISKSNPSITGGGTTDQAVKIQDKEYHKLMLRRKGLDEKREQRAESFMKRLKSLIEKVTTKDKKKRFRKRKRNTEEESTTIWPSVDIFEESDTEFAWTTRKLPLLQSRPDLMDNMIGNIESDTPDELTSVPGTILSKSALRVDSKMDMNAANEYYASLRNKEGGMLDRSTIETTVTSSAEEMNYPFRDLQYRIAEEEAIKSDEDICIRGRRQARKNKLILTMIKEADAYLLRETIDNNRKKALLRNELSKGGDNQSGENAYGSLATHDSHSRRNVK